MTATSLPRLCATLLPEISESTMRCEYTPSDHGVGIVHIGIGAFHRAHQAVFTDKALAKSGGNWRIVGASLRSANVSQQLNPQNGLYTVIERSAGKVSSKVVGAIKEVLNAQEKQSELLDYLASPKTKIVSLTVTEKGYHFDLSKGEINWQSKDIQHDLAHPETPITMPGYLLRACEKRMLASTNTAAKLTVISCDNLPENGHIIESVVHSLAAKRSSELLEWIRNNVSFCSSMVDRIVPSVTQEDIQEQAQRLGYTDLGLVITEPFKQWVIEDKFCTDRPDWESAGVLFVKHVSDYEKLKLRTLNGSHSALAYMGVLLGHKWIHEAINDPVLSKLIQRLMQQETGPTIPEFKNFDLAEYQDQIVKRFLNSDIAYATQQVAMDGSQKLQQRILAPMAELYSDNKQANTVCLMATLVCWLRYLKQETERGERYEVSDPYAEQLLKLVSDAGSNFEQLINQLFTTTSVIPTQLKNSEDFKQALLMHLTTIHKKGTATYLEWVLSL